MSDCSDTTVVAAVPVCGFWWQMLHRQVGITGLMCLCSWPGCAAQRRCDLCWNWKKMLQLEGGGGEGNKAAAPQCLCCFRSGGGEGKRKCKRLKVNLPAVYVGFGGPL